MRASGRGTRIILKPATGLGFFLLIAAAFIITGCASLSPETQYVRGLTQNTSYGQLKGSVDQPTGGLVWRGIKYARAPEGELRWRAPQAVEPWSGVKEATAHGPICAQRNPQNQVEGAEDCLTLDIYRPDSNQTGLPVYVWIHGGSNETGKAAGNNLSFFVKETNCVAVVIQYRLGPLGFFKHEALKTGDPLEDSGNFGLLDQIMAIKWVKENIARFGGNPKNVAIAGESAGAHDILALMACKQAAGLFHKVIYQSGGMQYRDAASAGTVAAGYVQNLNLSAQGAELAKALRASKTEVLLEAKPAKAAYDVIIDGQLIPASPYCLILSGDYNKVPILMGGNRNEYSLWLLLGGGPDGKWKKLWSILPKKKSRGKPLSELLTPDEVATYRTTNDVTGRVWQAKQVHRVARALRERQKDVFVYDFRWGGTKGSDVDTVFGAAHANEIAYFNFSGMFDIWAKNLSITEENKAAREALAKAMMTYTSQFIHTGNPNGTAKLPQWESWSNEKGQAKAINFDASSKPNDPTFIISMGHTEYALTDLYREINGLKDPIAQKFSKGIAYDRWNIEPACGGVK